MKFDKGKIDRKKAILIGIVFLVVIIALFIILSLTGVFSSKKANNLVDAPVNYEVEGISVPAFPVEEDVKVMETLPSKKDKKPKKDKKDEDESSEKEDAESSTSEENNTEETSTIIKTYTYNEISDLQTKISDYCNSLISKDIGFISVDDSNKQIDLPSFEALEGNVHLVLPVEKDSEPESDSLFSLNINWNVDSLNIVLSNSNGTVEKTEESNSMSLDSALDFLYNLPPSVYNLSGDSMRDYIIITLDGLVYVGNTPCMRVNIYSLNEVTNTNEIVGRYLLSSSGQDLYQIELPNNIKTLKLP